MGRNENPVVVAIRDVYPGFDQSLLSKTKYPDVYGIELVSGAEDIRRKALGLRKKIHRRKAKTHSWRCGKELESRLQTLKKALGVLTVQELITIAIMKLMEEVVEDV